MKKVLALNGSPRVSGNTSHLLMQFMEGAGEHSTLIETIYPKNVNISPCNGCLRCNLLKKCSIRGDDWAGLSEKILDADVLVFASPVYFHHVTAPLKTIIDRFRSFVHVRITESGLTHTPWIEWNKDMVVLLTMGSPDPDEATAIIELFEFMASIMGSNNKLHVITATRLAVIKQVAMQREDLEKLYEKLDIPESLVEADYKRNRQALQDCYNLGKKLTRPPWRRGN